MTEREIVSLYIPFRKELSNEWFYNGTDALKFLREIGPFDSWYAAYIAADQHQKREREHGQSGDGGEASQD